MKTNRYLLSLFAFYLAFLFLPGTGSAGEADEIRQEIENLRKEFREAKRIREEYDNRMKFIEKKLSELTAKEMNVEYGGDVVGSQDAGEVDYSEKADSVKLHKDLPEDSPFELSWSGYADILFSWFDHGPNQNRPGGSESDSRLELDLARFILELEGEMPAGLGFEAEIEFEHGGTGAAFEVEYEEFGEFEQEVEQGGEVFIEELYLRKNFGDWGKLKVGRFYIGYGLLSQLYKPSGYLAARRPESETMIIPAVWDEIGIGFNYYVNDNLDIAFQVVNGLDSTGFSSLNWVREGHQGKFETIQADGLAFVGRADYRFTGIGLTVGSSVYYGLNTNANRPKDDLEEVDSPLLLLDTHFILRHDGWYGSGVVMWGRLWNADDISARNSRLSNNLGVSRTAVGDNALAIWGELGYDVGPYVGLGPWSSLRPFFRVDYYDSMFEPRESLFDNPRYERLVLTSGLSYSFAESVFVKLDYAYRRVGDSTLNNEGTANLTLGWIY